MNNPKIPPTAKRRRQGKRHSPKKSEAIQFPRWSLSPRLCALILFVAVSLFAFIRVRLRDMPLERDEGEYAYAGQLILQGIPPYSLAYNMKLPGTYAAYAVILFFFGQNPSAVHVGLLVVNAATTIMMFFLAKRLFGSLAGITASIAYGLLSSGAAILGLQAHATHFVVLAAVAGLIVLTSARAALELFWSGMLLGLAFVMKQPGIFFGVFAVLQLACSDWRMKLPINTRLLRVGALSLGVALPFTITCIIMRLCGVFDRFWFWVFDYAGTYGATRSLGDGLEAFGQTAPQIIGPNIGIWLLAAIGATCPMWDHTIRRHALYCFGLLLFSFLAVCPGLFFRPHYFILMLPVVALLTGLAVSSATTVLRNQPGLVLAFLPASIFLCAFGYGFLGQRDVFFEMDPVTACRTLYPGEPFPEALVVSDYIRKNSDHGARIAMLGSDPEIYFYSRRHAATGYIYTFPLAEDQPYAQTMQTEMISEIEAAHPEYLVLHPGGWAMFGFRGYEERLSWASSYVRNYKVVGIVDRVTPDQTEFHWNQDAETYHPRNAVLYVLRRRQA